MNKSGKVLTIFLVIIAILLISLTAISMFFFQKEVERRSVAERNLDKLKSKAAQMDKEVKDAQKKMYVLEEKFKEADEKSEDLLSELELEQGLREEIKEENMKLKDEVETAVTERERLRETLNSDLKNAKDEIKKLEAQLSQANERNKVLEEAKAEVRMSPGPQTEVSENGAENTVNVAGKVESPELKEVVVSPADSEEGKVLSVDSDNGFVIINLGKKDGIAEGNVMSVYRKEKHIGDVKITRVQPEMSAADFIPPLNGRDVKRNDRVTKKNDS